MAAKNQISDDVLEFIKKVDDEAKAKKEKKLDELNDAISNVRSRIKEMEEQLTILLTVKGEITGKPYVKDDFQPLQTALDTLRTACKEAGIL